MGNHQTKKWKLYRLVVENKDRFRLSWLTLLLLSESRKNRIPTCLILNLLPGFNGKVHVPFSIMILLKQFRRQICERSDLRGLEKKKEARVKALVHGELRQKNYRTQNSQLGILSGWLQLVLGYAWVVRRISPFQILYIEDTRGRCVFPVNRIRNIHAVLPGQVVAIFEPADGRQRAPARRTHHARLITQRFLLLIRGLRYLDPHYVSREYKMPWSAIL